MESLTSQQNIGSTLAQKLADIGITTIEELKSVGSEQAFIKLDTLDCTACINMLYSLEGAIQGIRWHKLSPERKNELRDFFKTLKK
jgi:DNA transformation protein